MTRVKGIGRWSAEIYLLFAEGRLDIWPAGDLAVQIEIGRILGLPAKPTREGDPRAGRTWRPHRGAAAIGSPGTTAAAHLGADRLVEVAVNVGQAKGRIGHGMSPAKLFESRAHGLTRGGTAIWKVVEAAHRGRQVRRLEAPGPGRRARAAGAPRRPRERPELRQDAATARW
jgi:hypothetical protein